MICKCGLSNPDSAQRCSGCGEILKDPQYSQQGNVGSDPTLHPGYKAAKISLICGIVGIFIAGIILGIIAILQSNKARNLGYDGGIAKAGFVLGIIDIVLAVITFRLL